MFKKLKDLWIKYQSKFTILLSWLKVPLFAVSIGFLGAFGGSQNTSLVWRRGGISLILTCFAYWVLSQEFGYITSLWAITFMFYWVGSSIGYGIPNLKDPQSPWYDEGATLARFFWKHTKESERWTNVLTRGVVGAVEALAGLSIPILRNTPMSWFWYGFGAIGMVFVWAMCAWRPWGSFKTELCGKTIEYCWADIVTYTLQGVCFYIMICFK